VSTKSTNAHLKLSTTGCILCTIKHGNNTVFPGLGYILAIILSGSGAEKSVSNTLSPLGFQLPNSKGFPSVKYIM